MRSEFQRRLDAADAALAFVNVGPGDSRHRALVEGVATERLSAAQAVQHTVEQHGLSIDSRGAPTIRSFDDYLIPGSFVLRNRLVDELHPEGIDDPELLSLLDRQISRLRIVELEISPVRGQFDYDHLKQVHRRMFGDIFFWAGAERVGPETAMIRFAPDAVNHAPGDPAAPMTKYSYFSGSEIAEAVSVQCAQLSHLVTRSDLGRKRFFDLVAEHGGELNVIHPFRDGNLRALWQYAAQLEEQAGYPIDTAGFLKETRAHSFAMHSAYHFQATNDNDVMFRLMDEGLPQTQTVRTPPAG
ncbi:hypothetical protein B7R54_02735 [Subtercola boreus]|uniref:protein adenylyltransferase n=1 Tax=Subtercola boreus TaxID=120213 RepID=A0A3E0VEU9_9MICO|nr:Fic family protein [Subtercola boreus]RFA08261.1 hypothetical protein B7R54_02735 [Subtercola boreus]TQL54846.1 fido (protein-threonine AMPylation protein) [Subtercola boreus]